MNIGRIILNQILIMFILMAIGYVLYKKEWINDFGTKQMCTILMYICTPCIIVSAFEKEFNVDELQVLLLVIFLSTITIVGSLIIGKIFLKKNNTLGCFAVGFSNAGFIGIPLVQNVLGIEYVFYLTAYLAVFNISNSAQRCHISDFNKTVNTNNLFYDVWQKKEIQLNQDIVVEKHDVCLLKWKEK